MATKITEIENFYLIPDRFRLYKKPELIEKMKELKLTYKNKSVLEMVQDLSRYYKLPVPSEVLSTPEKNKRIQEIINEKKSGKNINDKNEEKLKKISEIRKKQRDLNLLNDDDVRRNVEMNKKIRELRGERINVKKEILDYLIKDKSYLDFIKMYEISDKDGKLFYTFSEPLIDILNKFLRKITYNVQRKNGKNGVKCVLSVCYKIKGKNGEVKCYKNKSLEDKINILNFKNSLIVETLKDIYNSIFNGNNHELTQSGSKFLGFVNVRIKMSEVKLYGSEHDGRIGSFIKLPKKYTLGVRSKGFLNIKQDIDEIKNKCLLLSFWAWIDKKDEVSGKVLYEKYKDIYNYNELSDFPENIPIMFFEDTSSGNPICIYKQGDFSKVKSQDEIFKLLILNNKISSKKITNSLDLEDLLDEKNPQDLIFESGFKAGLKNLNYHAVLIKNFTTAFRNKDQRGNIEVCCNCRAHIKSYIFDKHFLDCINNNKKSSTLQVPICYKYDPIEDEKLVMKSVPIRFTIFADFEAFTDKHNEHSVYSFAYKIHDFYQKINITPETEIFIRKKEVDEKTFVQKCITKIFYEIDKKLIPELEKKPRFEQVMDSSSLFCYICKLKESPYRCTNHKFPLDALLNDFCHITGKFLGKAHSNCRNKRVNIKKDKINIYFHNFAKYDSRLLVPNLKSYFLDWGLKNIHCKTSNSFRQITYEARRDVIWETPDGSFKTYIKKYQVNFMDSMGHVVTSLRSWVKGIGKENLIETSRMVEDPIKKELLLNGKGDFPHEAIHDVDFLDQELPDDIQTLKKLFHSNLAQDDRIDEIKSIKDKSSSQKEIDERVQSYFKIKKIFGFKTWREFHNYYLTLDVSLLMDCFTTYRKNAIKISGLDPAHFQTSPGWSWNTMCNLIRKPLNYIKDNQLYVEFQKNIRGGVSYAGKRISFANNKYMKEYDPTKPTKYIMYLDATSLYGCMERLKLPQAPFVEEENLPLPHKLLSCLENLKENYGCFVKCDITLPSNLHKKFREFPLFPNHNNGKLTADFTVKKEYIVHYKVLKYGLSKGYECTKIHKIWKFKEEAFAKDFVDSFMEKRKKCKKEGNTVLSNMYKLVLNSVYGKFLENVFKYNDTEILITHNNRENLLRKLSSFKCTDWELFADDEFICIKNKKNIINLDKFPHMGLCILDNSKLFMQKTFYEDLVPLFGKDNIKLIMTDTDSLMIEITGHEDVYEVLGKANKEGKINLDMSDTKKEREPYFKKDESSRSKPGTFKDELGGKLIYAAIANRAKEYCFLTEDDISNVTLKGIKQKNKKYYDFKSFLNNFMDKEGISMDSFTNFKCNKERKIETIEVKKVALNCQDEKVEIAEDRINFYPLEYQGEKDKNDKLEIPSWLKASLI